MLLFCSIEILVVLKYIVFSLFSDPSAFCPLHFADLHLLAALGRSAVCERSSVKRLKSLKALKFRLPSILSCLLRLIFMSNPVCTPLPNPTQLLDSQASPDEQKLYALVWARFMASHMAPATYDTVSIAC